MLEPFHRASVVCQTFSRRHRYVLRRESRKFVEFVDGVLVVSLGHLRGSVLLLVHEVLLDGLVAFFLGTLEVLNGVLRLL